MDKHRQKRRTSIFKWMPGIRKRERRAPSTMLPPLIQPEEEGAITEEMPVPPEIYYLK